MMHSNKNLAVKCKVVIETAEKDGLVIDNNNVVDLCADNINTPIIAIREALSISKEYAERFKKAIGYSHN